MGNEKVLIIGLDGATWDLIRPWIEDGKLPMLRKLMKGGAWGILQSTIPPWTIPAWCSMTTGKNPSKLCFSTFMIKQGYTFRPYFLAANEQRKIWDILSDNGKTVCLCNLPDLHYPYKINGHMVVGWLYRDKKRLTYPIDLIDELNNLVNGYKIDIMEADVEKGKIIGSPSAEDYLRSVEELLEKHSLTFEHLLTNKNWDFGFVVFTTPDRIQHRYWDEGILLNHYQKIDKKLDELLSMLDDNITIFLVSDHGFGQRDYIFNINDWLIREGYLRLKNQQNKTKFLLLMVNLSEKLKVYGLIKAVVNLLPSRIPTHIKAGLKEINSSKSFEQLEIDWKNAKAFAYGVFGDIYINIKGREPEGTVSPSDYDKIRDEIIKKLKELKHNRHNDKGLAVKVFKKEEIYVGATLNDHLPDIVILPTNDGIQSINSNVSHGEMFVRSNGGEHRLDGIFLAYGKNIKKGLKIQNAKIYEIAPTILHIFGLPIPNDMDGKVLTEIFKEGSELRKRKPIYTEPRYYEKKDNKDKSVLTDRDEEQVRKRLEGLGYLS